MAPLFTFIITSKHHYQCTSNTKKNILPLQTSLKEGIRGEKRPNDRGEDRMTLMKTLVLVRFRFLIWVVLASSTVPLTGASPRTFGLFYKLGQF